MADRQNDHGSRSDGNRSQSPEEAKRASGSDSVEHVDSRDDRGNRAGEGIGSSASRREPDDASEEDMGAAEGSDLGSSSSGSRNINGSSSGMNSSSGSTGHLPTGGLEESDRNSPDRGMQ